MKPKPVRKDRLLSESGTWLGSVAMGSSAGRLLAVLLLAGLGFFFPSALGAAPGATPDAVPGATPKATEDEAAVNFSRQIRPILSRNCLSCHGGDEGNRQVGLRLDTFEGATADRGGYQAIVPGNSAASRVMARITHPDIPMPPEATGKKLKPEEIELIKNWIDQGAKYDQHWSFVKPVRPPLLKVKNEKWAKNEIDSFVLARLEKEGLSPSKEADPYTLIRRIYLDLIGIPPTPEQVDAYIKDEKSDAYERLVNKLLNSPHYGEKWARVWLDLARYADSQGYEADASRSIWPYRDWVIRALNQNMPFDQFTKEQIAGDLLPVPTEDQLIATGFHRNTMSNSEGGTDDEEFRDQAIRDRVATTMQVWMGLTAACAQCHSHKYDPLTHTEFYQLYAFLDQTEDSDKPDDRPFMKVGEGETTTLIMRELAPDKRRTTHILERGNFLTKGAIVTPAVPKAFHPFPQGAPKNRLGLAKWLTDKNNPLTARVTVNRFWARLFGTGLVQTEEDFGTQGFAPTHPKLIDWLATEFMRLDWDIKGIIKTMVMSATYRQSSNITPEMFERDQYNQLLARGPRFRISAEMVRDQALAAGGLLSTKMYGPTVMPLQPEGVWQAVYSSAKWETSEGEDRYRRGLYTYWRRTSPYPSMMTLDASSREICTLRRIRTNTPLQALVTLNDPVYVEAAQRLAQRVTEQGGSSVEDRALYAYRLCLVRKPTSEELQRTVGIYREALQYFQKDTAAARKLIYIDQDIYFDKSRFNHLIKGARAHKKTSSRWRYTLRQPADGEGWMKDTFDDSGWNEGAGVFGKSDKEDENEKKSAKKVDGEEPEEANKQYTYPTEWDTNDLWMRREFDLSENDLEKFTLELYLRGNYEIYLNGVEVEKQEGGFDVEREVDITKAALSILRQGRNLLAIHCSHLGEEEDAQFADIGFTALRPKDPIPVKPDDAERAAWTLVGNVLLNLDETLTKR